MLKITVSQAAEYLDVLRAQLISCISLEGKNNASLEEPVSRLILEISFAYFSTNWNVDIYSVFEKFAVDN